MRTYTWAQIRTKIRQRVNKETSQFITDSEIDSMMEEAYAEMYNVLINRNENYFISSTTINTVAGTSLYSLPADFFKLKGVDLNTSGFITQLSKLAWEKRSIYNYALGVGGVPISYDFYNNQIKLFPTPSTASTLTVYYIPAPPVYTSDAQTIDGVAGFETYIIYTVAATIRAKEEKDASLYIARRKVALDNLIAAVTPRDMENAITVTDILYYDV